MQKAIRPSPASTARSGRWTVSVTNVTQTNVKVWGLGLVQNVDAAATELYIGYRKFHLDTTQTAAGIAANTNVVTGAATGVNTAYKDVDMITAGARIKF